MVLLHLDAHHWDQILGPLVLDERYANPMGLDNVDLSMLSAYQGGLVDYLSPVKGCLQHL